jgi:DNA-binding NarL/FixJ family response regulator
MRRFLLIDDDDHEFMYVNFLFKDRFKNEFSLVHAANLTGALDYLSKKTVEMILLDDKLGDGLTSAESIPILQRKAFNVPMVVISKDITSKHLKDRVRLRTNIVVDKFDLKKALAAGVFDVPIAARAL